MQDISLLLVYGMGKRFVNATGGVEKIILATESKRDFSFDVSDLVCIKIEIFFLLCMSHILFKSNSLLPSCTVEFHVFSKKTLDGGNGFSSQECTEDSADSDAVESVEDCKGKNHSSRHIHFLKLLSFPDNKYITMWMQTRNGS